MLESSSNGQYKCTLLKFITCLLIVLIASNSCKVTSFSLSSLNVRTRTRTRARDSIFTFMMNKKEQKSASKPQPKIELEVEQKFVIRQSKRDSDNDSDHGCSNDTDTHTDTNIDGVSLETLQERLTALGFARTNDNKAISFMDWYFDVLDPDKNKNNNKGALPANLVLCIQDCWLRYRHLSGDISQGSWQLKKGSRVSMPSRENVALLFNSNVDVDADAIDEELAPASAAASASGSTVYEEVEGDEAIRIVSSMLQRQKFKLQILLDERSRRHDSDVDSSLSLCGKETKEKITSSIATMMDGYEVPQVPLSVTGDIIDTNNDHNDARLLELLAPFARIETTRSSWIFKEISCKDVDGNGNGNGNGDSNISRSRTLYDGISVDIDATDSGFMVGEVESIVSHPDDVVDAKERIGIIIRKLSRGEYDDGEDVKQGNLDMEGSQKDEIDDAIPLSSAVVAGKLETYLMDNQKEIYDACVGTGSL